MPRLTHLYRYPVKGLNGEPLSRAELRENEVIPCDRRFALAHADAEFDPSAPSFVPKQRLLMLMKNERLAQLDARYDQRTGTLQLYHRSAEVVHARVSEPAGRASVEAFFAEFMSGEIRGAPRLLCGAGHAFTDCSEKSLSLINLASVRDLERTLATSISHRRFRANLYFDDAPAWSELNWVSRRLRIGEVELEVLRPIDRCAAINVDPDTAVRDRTVLQGLRQHYGHLDMGVYARVVRGGSMETGQAVEVLNDAADDNGE